MPKRKTPELSKEEQFKRFHETAKNLDVDEDQAIKAFTAVVPKGAKGEGSKKGLKLR